MAYSASEHVLRYTSAMTRRSLAYGLLIAFVLMSHSWIGTPGTAVILFVTVAWLVWDTWREWNDDDDDNH